MHNIYSKAIWGRQSIRFPPLPQTYCMRLCKQTRIQTCTDATEQSFGVQLAPKTHSLAWTQQQTSPTNRLRGYNVIWWVYVDALRKLERFSWPGCWLQKYNARRSSGSGRGGSRSSEPMCRPRQSASAAWQWPCVIGCPVPSPRNIICAFSSVHRFAFSPRRRRRRCRRRPAVRVRFTRLDLDRQTGVGWWVRCVEVHHRLVWIGRQARPESTGRRQGRRRLFLCCIAWAMHIVASRNRCIIRCASCMLLFWVPFHSCVAKRKGTRAVLWN
jgi:hypothetical protein